MRASFVTLLLLLAGCSDGAPPRTEPDTPEAPAEEATAWPVEAAAVVGPETACTALVCNSPGMTRLFFAAANASVQRIELEVGPAAGVEDVLWSLECVARVSCARNAKVAQGEGPLPLRLEVPYTSLPPGAEVWLRLRAPGTAPETYWRPDVEPLKAVVTGTVWTVPQDAIPVERVAVEATVDGLSGACVYPVDPDCHGMPGGTEHVIRGIEGHMVAAEITMSWDSSTSGDEVLGVQLVCGELSRRCHDPTPHQASGPSPLVLNVTGVLWESPMVTLQAFHPDPAGSRAAGTRTPVHYEVRLWDERVLGQDT